MAYNWTSTIAHSESGHDVVLTISITDFRDLPECLRDVADSAARWLGQPLQDLAAENAELRAELDKLKEEIAWLRTLG